MAELPTIKQMMDLSGKTAIVTGGARGLGLAIVNRLSEAGACVMIADIQAELGQEAKEATREIQSKDRQVAFTHADVREDPKMAKEKRKGIRG